MVGIYFESHEARARSKNRLCLLRSSMAWFGVKLRGVLLLAIAAQSGAFLIQGCAKPRGAPRARSRVSVKMTANLPFNLTRSPDRWKDDDSEIEPGFGGFWPGDPNAEKRHVKWVTKNGETVGAVDVPVDRYLFYASEEAGMDVPFINKKRMCRQGCCTTCAVKVLEGKVESEGALGLVKDLRQEGYTLTCCSYPRSDLVLELQEEDEVYIRQFGESFEGGGVEWGGFLPEED